MRIKINEIAKIEGHSGFEAILEKGKVKKAFLWTKEGARLFEGILAGRSYEEASLITARICGICPVVHNLTAIKAIENAFGVKPALETVILRKILELAQIVQSHTFHFYFMALGDYFRLNNSLDLLEKLPKASSQALKIRGFANQLIERIGGRAVHPLRTMVGGFTVWPKREWLVKFLKEAPVHLNEAGTLVQVFKKLKPLVLRRETSFMALSAKNEYAIYEGDLMTSGGVRIPREKFEHQIEEVEIPYSISKRARYQGKSYLVGPLARLNLNRQKLNPVAKKILQSWPAFPSTNTFFNPFAQVVEVVHCLEEIQKLLGQAVKSHWQPKNVSYKIKAGRGVGYMEAPRGTLYHYYELDRNGKIVKANLITPTQQFLANLEDDLKVYLSAKDSALVRERKIKMLVRAYDPCMTCATH